MTKADEKVWSNFEHLVINYLVYISQIFFYLLLSIAFPSNFYCFLVLHSTLRWMGERKRDVFHVINFPLQ